MLVEQQKMFTNNKNEYSEDAIVNGNMNLVENEDDNFTMFASIVNENSEKFKFVELSPDNFKCLIFVQQRR